MNDPIRTPIRPRQNKPPAKARRGKFATFVVYSFCIAVLLALVLGHGLWLVTTIAGKQELTQSGVQSSATITKHHSEIVRGGKSSNEKFLIDYTFTSHDQMEEHDTDVELPVDLWNAVEVGSTISVTYKPNDPSDNQPTMMLKRLLPELTDIVQFYVGAVFAAIVIWIAFILLRLITSLRRKSKAADPRTGITNMDTPKKRRSKHATPKTQMPENVRGILALIAIFLGFLAILTVFLGVFVFGIEFVGALVVDVIQNSLL